MAKSKFYRVTANDPTMDDKEISCDMHYTDTTMSFAAWCEKNLYHLNNVKYEPLDRVLDDEIKIMLDKVKIVDMQPWACAVSLRETTK